MGVSPSTGRDDLTLLLGFLASYVLRALTSPVERWLRHNCYVCAFGRGPNSGAVLATERTLSWREARARLDVRGGDAPLAVLAALRLFGWHWLQPVSFILIFFSWSDEITSRLQVGLGLAVSVRELLYLLCTVAAVIVNPVFLLIDVVATWQSGARGEVVLYALMPEKFLGWHLAGTNTLFRQRFNVYCVVILLCDGCALLGLYLSTSGRAPIPAPLVACYLVSVVSLFAMPLLALLLLVAQQMGYMPGADHGSDTEASLDAPLEPLG